MSWFHRRGEFLETPKNQTKKIFSAIETCAELDAHLWAPNDEHDMKILAYFMPNIMPGWVGVVADPPYWYALKDWLNAGCNVLNSPIFTFYEKNECPQQTVTW